MCKAYQALEKIEKNDEIRWKTCTSGAFNFQPKIWSKWFGITDCGVHLPIANRIACNCFWVSQGRPIQRTRPKGTNRRQLFNRRPNQQREQLREKQRERPSGPVNNGGRGRRPSLFSFGSNKKPSPALSKLFWFHSPTFSGQCVPN